MSHTGKSRLEVGRVEINYPKPEYVEVYEKRNGNIGAVFISETDASRCGLNSSLLDTVEELGTYWGWGYVDETRSIVFEFVSEAEVEVGVDIPEPLLAIRTPRGRVGFPEYTQEAHVNYADGMLVAFYACFAGHESYAKRAATDVFLLDTEHFPIVARVVAVGQLTFPECDEVLDTFLHELSRPCGQDPQNRSLVRLALDRAANDVGIPSQYRTLARVERSKMFPASGTRKVDSTLRTPTDKHSVNQPTSAARTATARAGGNGIVTDVSRLNLRIPPE